MQVAIDTSTAMASLALVQDTEVLAELTWHCGQNHSTELLPHLEYLLKKTGTSIKSASGVFVALGPGSFNGIRVGVSTAKGLALSLDVPIIGVSTLEIEAYPHAETGLPICPVFNAGREEIAIALYQKKGNLWSQIMGEHITTLEALCSQTTDRTVFCGEFVSALDAELRKRLGEKAIIPAWSSRIRRACVLADLGQGRLKTGNYQDLATLQPIYLRRPHITQPKNREGDRT